MLRRLLGATAALSLVAGCTVGPNYHPPKNGEVPAGYAEPHAVTVPGENIDPATWWTAFGDPELDTLVTRALAGNPDVLVAASRVRQARLQEIQAHAVDKPTVDATANTTYLHFSKNAGVSQLASLFGGGSGGSTGGSGSGSGTGGSGGSGSTSSGGIALPGSGILTYSVGFDANWELDLFGGGRRGVEAARASADAAVWNARDAEVMLAAEVADAYFQLRLDQQQGQILEDEIARQRRALEIEGHIAKVGLVPSIDVTRQRASITSNEAQLDPLKADVQMRVHALGTLLGVVPETLTGELTTAPAALGPAPLVPAGLPSDLLRRRPDIRAAERNLAAATAQIGVAVADLYPHFSLTGMAELISTALGNLFTPDSFQGTGTGAIQFPLLDWGRREATVGLRKEDREQAYQNYKKTVIGALRDVEDPLAQIAAERHRNQVLHQALTDQESALKAIAARYQTGFVAEDSLLNAQNDVLAAREQIAMSDAQLREETAALFKALGGGWQTVPVPETGLGAAHDDAPDAGSGERQGQGAR